MFKALAFAVFALTVAGCGGSIAGSSQAGSSVHRIDAATCRTLDQDALSEMGQIAATLVTHGSQSVAEQTTNDLLANKRRAYDGGCISKAEYLKFLNQNEAALKTYDCQPCVDAFEAARAKVK
jgi:hypothetical protein